jgi:hypothetical protein|mmetsp:Transcript_29455/g.53963  ORF Transcript_29455/g.53963 Transcript_29455/m.53963 type:complete len:210 (-) Transcript_29455:1479-2108(-)
MMNMHLIGLTIERPTIHTRKESANCYKGTVHEDDWFFYHHDALSLITAQETIKWMKEKYYFKHWILPENGLHYRDPDLKTHSKRPTGDSPPENVPWDNSLNQDVHLSVDMHVAMTHDLEIGDPRKFDLSTPKRDTDAYCHILIHPITEGVPSSKRIIRDCEKVLESMEIVRQAGGIKVDGVGNRKGKHEDTRGGYMPRKWRGNDYRFSL